MTVPREIDILLVEDDPGDAELTILALQKRNLAKCVHVARDGEEALEYLFGQGSSQAPLPRLIILDLKLPKVDGLEVLRKVKSSDRTKGIPVVMYTSSVEAQDVASCYLAGANSYVQKPMDFETIMERVGEMGTYWLNHNCTQARYANRMPLRAQVL